MTTIAVQIATTLVRAGIVSRLESVDDVTVLADMAEVVDLLDVLDRNSDVIDVVVLECDRGERAWVDTVLTQVATRAPGVGIVGLHSDLPAARIGEIQSLGVRCLVDRSSGFDALAAAVSDPLRPTRRRWLASTIGPLPLTHRESQVLTLISEGYTAKEVADTLGISARTVEAHKQRVYAKLGVQNQAHAVSAALRANQIGSSVPVETVRRPLPAAPLGADV